MQKVRLEDLGSFAKKVVERIEQPPRTGAAYVLALEGDLGAGKTTFTQALAKQLCIPNTIQSPTYVLMKSYDVPPPPAGGWLTRLVHIDAYRLDKPEEFTALKPAEFLQDPHALVVVEWPERLQDVLPPPDLTIKFSSDGVAEEERFVEIR